MEPNARSVTDTLPQQQPKKGISEITREQRLVERRSVIMIIVFVLVLLGIAVAELSSGASNMDVFASIRSLFGYGTRGEVAAVQNIRLPRVVCGIISGAGLAIAGCVLQSVLENPLASASTIGISQGAAFGATLAILVIVPMFTGRVTNLGMGTTAAFAFGGAMISALIVLAFSQLGNMKAESIVLVGVALSALFSGASTIMQYFADDVELSKVIFWEFGDLGRATWNQMAFMAIVGAGCSIYFFLNRWNYNALLNGGHVAGGLGVNVKHTRVVGVAVASLAAAVMVSFVGLISFIGLIAPHIARRFIGNDYRFLLPASLVLGSAIMLASDFVARMVLSPIILPIGAITSFMGAPLFLYLLYRGYHK
ncbi:MAG: iron ABC transporter permease [Coriobacteriales bacterium]|nr:iron ABC transporter permease [Coriobacteriales bacterium]